MRVLLTFLLIVVVGAIVTSERERAPRAVPLLALCAFFAMLLYSQRLI